MNDNQEYLYTDYAIQILSAFLNKETHSIAGLLDTFDNELEDPAFVPGILFGFLIHIESLFSTLADLQDMSVSEVFQKYALYYDSIREELEQIQPLKPSFAKQALKELKDELGL
jgi:hypothetical protein